MKTREADTTREAARALLECLPGWRFLPAERKEALLQRKTAALEAARVRRSEERRIRDVNAKGRAK